MAKSSVPLREDDDYDFLNARAVAPPRPMTDFVGVGIRGRAKSNNNGSIKPDLNSTVRAHDGAKSTGYTSNSVATSEWTDSTGHAVGDSVNQSKSALSTDESKFG